MHGVDEAGMPAPVRPVVNASGPTKSELLATLKQVKYRPPVGSVDNVYGDRNLFCSCVPVVDCA